MTSFGQYPLVYQLRQTGDGSFIPVGLAEVSAFTSLSAVTLVVSSISATNYQGLDLGSIAFTGVQTITVTGQGSSILITTDPANPVLRGLVFDTGGFLTPSVPAPGDPNVTITYGSTPLAPTRGGTGFNSAGGEGQIPAWTADGTLEPRPGFLFNDVLGLDLPTGTNYLINGSQITLSNLEGIASPATLEDIPAPTTPNTYLIYNGSIITWSAVTGTGSTTGGPTIVIPTTPGRILISVDSTSTTSDPQLTYTLGTDTLNTYSINNVCDVCAIRFNEGGTLLSVKYLDRASTGVFETTGYSRSNFATIASLNSYVLTSTYTQFTGTLKELAYKDRIDLQTTSVTGALQVLNGGLGLTSVDQNKILVGAAANTYSQIVAPGAGVPNYLRWNGTTFTWDSPTGTVSLPTDPCAVVFMNATGTGLLSNPKIRINNGASTLEIFSNLADGTGGLDIAPDTADEGFLRWDHNYDTLGIQGVNNTNISLGVDDLIPIVNKTGVTITRGAVVYVSGAESAGYRGRVGLLSNTNRSAGILGVCLADMSNNGTGYAIKKGLIKNQNRSSIQQSGDPTWVEGDTLYVGTTAGRLTTVHSAAGNRAAKIGIVVEINGANASIGVNVDRGYDLSELHDVCATPSNNGDILVWTTAGAGYYANGGINDITGTLAVTKGGTGTTSFNNKSVLFYNSLSVPPALTTDPLFTFENNILRSPTVCATMVCATVVCGTTVVEGGQTLITKYYDRTSTGVFALTANLGELAYSNQVNLTTTSVTGVLAVTKGGTGLATLTAGNFLVGNGTAIILQPTSTFETTGYSRSNFATIASLNSYVLTSTYNSFTGTLSLSSSLTDVQITSVAPNQVLKWNSSLSKWTPANDTTGTGGGTPGGNSGQVQVNSENSFAGNPGLTYDLTTSTLRAQFYSNLPSGSPIWNANQLSGYPIVSGLIFTGGPLLGDILQYFNTPTVPSNGWYWTQNAAATPGGATTQIQFNNAGSFSGSPALIWDNSTSTLAVTGNIRSTTYVNLPSGVAIWNANKIQGLPVTIAGDTIYDILLSNGGNTGYANVNLLTLASDSAAGWNAAKLQGTIISNVAPTATQHLGYDGTNWKPHWNSYSSITATSITLPDTCSNKLFISDTSNTYIELPNPTVCAGKQINIIKSGVSGYPIQVSSPYLDTATSTITINIPRDSIELISDGNAWFVNNVRQVYGHGRTIYLDDFVTGSNETGEIGQYGWSFLNGAVTHLNTTGTNIDGTGRGIIHRATAATINQVASFFPLLQGTNTIFNMKDVLEFRARLCLSSTLNVICRVGIMNDATASGEPVRGIYFETSSGPNWLATTRNNNTQTRTDTGVALASNTAFQTLRFFRREDGGIEFYINNNLVASHTTNIPSDPTWGLPALVLVPTTASSRAISIDYIGFCIVDYDQNRYL